MDTNTKPYGSSQWTTDLDDDALQQFGAEFDGLSSEQVLVALHKAVQE